MTDRLTIKQEKFCQKSIEFGNQIEAYRESYNAQNMKDVSVSQEINTLNKNPKIALRIQELENEAAELAAFTLGSHIVRLKTLSGKAETAENYSAAISAEKAAGEAVGLYIKKHELTGKDGKDLMPNDDIRKAIIEAAIKYDADSGQNNSGDSTGQT